jgi:hypothetical protein
MPSKKTIPLPSAGKTSCCEEGKRGVSRRLGQDVQGEANTPFSLLNFRSLQRNYTDSLQAIM